ncbi:MAG: hypothetical protein Q7S01_04765 [bacterium]|nr:hypothetical protein [bacterium]
MDIQVKTSNAASAFEALGTLERHGCSLLESWGRQDGEQFVMFAKLTDFQGSMEELEQILAGAPALSLKTGI